MDADTTPRPNRGRTRLLRDAESSLRSRETGCPILWKNCFWSRGSPGHCSLDTIPIRTIIWILDEQLFRQKLAGARFDGEKQLPWAELLTLYSGEPNQTSGAAANPPESVRFDESASAIDFGIQSGFCDLRRSLSPIWTLYWCWKFPITVAGLKPNFTAFPSIRSVRHWSYHRASSFRAREEPS